MDADLEVIRQEIENITESEHPQPTQASETAQSTETPDNSSEAVKDLAKVATQTITERVKSGETSFHTAVVDVAKAGAAAQAISEHGDEYAQIEHQNIKTEMYADGNEARARRTRSANQDNEEFYKRFRPILEFDFGHITGNEKVKSAKETEPKSYSKLLMILTLLVATVPYLLFSFVLYIIKGVNAFVELVNTFTKIARSFVWSALIITICYIIFRVVSFYVEYYCGIQIMPPL